MAFGGVYEGWIVALRAVYTCRLIFIQNAVCFLSLGASTFVYIGLRDALWMGVSLSFSFAAFNSRRCVWNANNWVDLALLNEKCSVRGFRF